MCNISFISCIKMVQWSQEFSRPDSVWEEWVPNTFPFRNLTFECRSFGQVDLALFLFYFRQIVIKTKSHVIIWYDPKLCNFQFFYSINKRNNSVMYFQFFFFFNKKLNEKSTSLTQKKKKKKVPKSTQKSFFFERYFCSLLRFLFFLQLFHLG